MTLKKWGREQALEAMMHIVRHYGVAVSEEAARASLAWQKSQSDDQALEWLAKYLGLSLRFAAFDKSYLDNWRLPVVLEFEGGRVGLLRAYDGKGAAGVVFSGDQGQETPLDVAQLLQTARRVWVLRPMTAVADARVDDYIRPYQPDWFKAILLRDWRRYGDVVLASLFANILALATVIFSMQIYDRVVPAQSEASLWVLFAGVSVAIVFEFMLRVSRMHVSDVLGKRADLRVADLVFGHALRIRNQDRSKSTGSFIAQIREVEQVRELMTSTTISAVADLPFFILFVGILWVIGGPLAWVALAALPLLVIPGLLLQRPLARLANSGMRESALRNAMLVEAVEGLEDIKLMRAEARFQSQWNHANEVSAEISKRQRFLTGLLTTWTQSLQSIVYAVVLLLGCYLVIDGSLTTGALVATSILTSRTLSPVSQLASVLTRWQQAKVARKGLHALMERPVDQPPNALMVHVPAIRGAFKFEGVKFQYGEKDPRPALTIAQLEIQPGEKIAVLGRIGAGKSTLLHLMSGLLQPQQGRVTLDGLDLSLIDPADVRRDVGLLTQNAKLFFGTVRENVMLGMPQATDAEIIKAITMAGARGYLQTRAQGLDEMILEGGVGMSGGQRQALLLARTLIRNPEVLLLDEPTANFDDLTEQQVLAQLKSWLQERTLIVSTHRMQVLQLVDRIIVVDGGRVVMDGSKQKVLERLTVNENA